jgi:hypothetical protein
MAVMLSSLKSVINIKKLLVHKSKNYINIIRKQLQYLDIFSSGERMGAAENMCM